MGATIAGGERADRLRGHAPLAQELTSGTARRMRSGFVTPVRIGGGPAGVRRQRSRLSAAVATCSPGQGR
ncbi:hypothetical protein TBS_18850 [Thermobispora bispora]